MLKKATKLAIEIIKRFEGCKLTAYLCPAKKWTIGYGHTKGVKEGQTITQQEAEALLAADLAWVERAVANNVSVNLEPHQEAALLSFVFNVGEPNFRESTLLRMVNDRLFASAAKQFLSWVWVTKNGVKRKSAGLIRRREAEKKLFSGEA